MSVDDKRVLGRSLDGSIESALGRIIFQQVSQIVGGNQIIDSDNFKFVAEKSLINKGSEDQTTDAAESINSNFSRHFVIFVVMVSSKETNNQMENAPRMARL